MHVFVLFAVKSLKIFKWRKLFIIKPCNCAILMRYTHGNKTAYNNAVCVTWTQCFSFTCCTQKKIILKMRKTLVRNKNHFPENGYQPNYHFTSTISDWSSPILLGRNVLSSIPCLRLLNSAAGQ